MKKLVVVAMIFLLGTAWWSTIDNFGVKKAEYRQHIAAAEIQKCTGRKPESE